MKLVSNATTLVSTALFGMSIHEGAASPEGRDLMPRSGQEALDVGQALGHPVPPIFGTNLDLSWPIEVTTDMALSRKLASPAHQSMADAFLDLFSALRADWIIP